MPYIGKRLIQVITDKKLDQHPIFFHVFSNGGAFLYQHVSLAMQQANSPLKVIEKGKNNHFLSFVFKKKNVPPPASLFIILKL